MTTRVLLVTADLMFRSKLGGVVATGGGAVTRDETGCDLVVLDLTGPGAGRVAAFVRRGIPVLAYGAHLEAERLRAAREAGATAVPNSQVEATLRTWLEQHVGAPHQQRP